MASEFIDHYCYITIIRYGMSCSKSANSRQSIKNDTNNIGVSYMDTQF